MRRASEAIARGEYDQQIAVRGGDEVAQLARTFNAMAREVGSSHRTLRNFLADVSHELRTPLTSIQGFSQAILDGTAARPDDQHEAAEVIHEEAERMRRLVDDLLYLSKIESGQIAMPPQAVDLPHVFDRFYQVDKSRARAGTSAQGSGLGLAIAREIVQAHGGTVAANSDPATGTEFIVTIPVTPPLPIPPTASPAMAAVRG